MRNSKTTRALFIFSSILAVTLASNANAVGCRTSLTFVRERVARLFARPTPAVALPPWVEDSKAIDRQWWQTIADTEKFESVDRLRLEDGSEVRIGRYVGRGFEGVIYCLPGCTSVIKLPRIPQVYPSTLIGEVARSVELVEAGFHIAAVTHHSREGDLPWVVKPYIDGRSLKLVQSRRMSPAQIEGLAEIYVRGLRSGVHFDLLGLEDDNVLWSEARQSWILVDLSDLGKETSRGFFLPFETITKRWGKPRSTADLYLTRVFKNDHDAFTKFKDHALRRLAEPSIKIGPP